MKQFNKLNSIAFKMVSGFMVVIIFIIVLGAVSYNSSSSAMLDSYKKNMAGTVNTTATYLNLGMSQVSAEAQKIIENGDFYNYYRGAYKNDKPHEYMLWSSLYNTAQAAASASDFIMAISVIGSYGDGISSAGTLEQGFYDSFKKFAILIAIAVALFLAFSMHKAINTVVGALEKAAGGDLTGNVRLNRKDEFGILANSINGMISSMKGLLNKVDQISSLVQSSSDDVSKTSELLVSSSDEIYNAMSEIESGTSSQAREAEKCLEHMDGLSDRINVLTTNTSAIETISRNTKDYVSQGRLTSLQS